MAEFTEPEADGLLAQGEKDEKLVGSISQCFPPTWKVHVDGASNKKGAGVGLVLTSSEMITIEKSLRLSFPTIEKSLRLSFQTKKAWSMKLY